MSFKPDAALVRLDQVSLTYPGPPPVGALRPTTLEIATGEYLSITGPSGSGKSTLLAVLGLLERPTDGTVLVDATDVATLGSKDYASLRARTFGYVFQRFHLLSAISAQKNVELALMYQGITASRRALLAQEALARVGLGLRFDHRPAELSGGEQQRVAIARAVACRQPCLLADEPTGNLDSATAGQVLDLLDQIAEEGTTVVCVTHSDEVAQRADRHLQVLDGQLVADRRVT